jgi:hypothetical protein
VVFSLFFWFTRLLLVVRLQREKKGMSPAPDSGWEEEWKRVQPTLDKYKASLSAKAKALVRILRVNQLDALRLDQEIHEVLYQQFIRMFSFFRVRSFAFITSFIHFVAENSFSIRFRVCVCV